MKTVTENKNELRCYYLKIRKNINNKLEKSLKIINKLIETEEFKKAKNIALYKNLKSEVDTNYILEYAIKSGKNVSLPRVYEEKLIFYKVDINENYELSNYGIEEPQQCQEKIMPSNEIELIIVPGVCFDLKRNRLGYGGGYYDRFLENKAMNIIGICFDEQLSKDKLIPINKTDIKMNKIITESCIISE